jgi:hypothetical protein
MSSTTSAIGSRFSPVSSSSSRTAQACTSSPGKRAPAGGVHAQSPSNSGPLWARWRTKYRHPSGDWLRTIASQCDRSGFPPLTDALVGRHRHRAAALERTADGRSGEPQRLRSDQVYSCRSSASSSASGAVRRACQKPNPTSIAMTKARVNAAIPAQKAIVPNSEKA